MEDGGISRIVAIEKEIQERIEGERKKAEQWLEEVKRKAERDLVRIEEDAKRIYNERLSFLEKEIRNNASNIIEEAMRWHQWVNNLDEDKLKTVLLKFIMMIIPEKVREIR
ncbi:MAG: hypothetical protein ACK4Z9_00370 [Thermodesulfovibrionales bacterium]